MVIQPRMFSYSILAIFFMWVYDHVCIVVCETIVIIFMLVYGHFRIIFCEIIFIIGFIFYTKLLPLLFHFIYSNYKYVSFMWELPLSILYWGYGCCIIL